MIILFYVSDKSFNLIKISVIFPAVFNEFTVAGLRHYASKPGWNDTAKVLDFVINTWKIINEKNIHKGNRAHYLEVI